MWLMLCTVQLTVHSATDSMQVPADILPKTHFRLFKGEKYNFSISTQNEATNIKLAAPV